MVILASFAGASRPALAEYTVEVVKSFELLPWGASELVAGPDGALYGTSSQSYTRNGTIFRIDSTGTLTILHVFDPEAEGYPTGKLTLESDGSLYGTTGSAYGPGTIYKIDSTGYFTLVHRLAGCDGLGRLVLGGDSALYGICAGSGTVIRIDSQGTFTLLHPLWDDGYYPQGSLTAGSDGALYGTSHSLVFRIDPADGTVTPIYRFAYDRALSGSLTVGSDGALYGTTLPYQIVSSGQYVFADGGTVFRVDPAGNFRTLHTFAWADGRLQDRLTAGSDGTIYGTTVGTVFKIDGTGTFTSLHSFGSTTGPNSALTLGSDGAVYGTIPWGGVFRVDSAGNFTVVHSPPEPGQTGYLRQPLTLGSDGALYGTSECCYTGQMDSVFKIDPDGSFISLRSFSIPEEGSGPSAPLVVGRDGALYGTTVAGGSADGGTVFRLDSTGAFQSLVSLPLYGPLGELVVGANGILYGRSSDPGSCSSGEGGPTPGSVFGVDPGGNYSVVHTFDCSAPVPGPLTVGADGAIWGTASGQSVESAAVFRIDSGGAFATLYAGMQPSSLTLGPDGVLYGTNPGYRYYPNPGGAVFRVDNTLVPSVLHVFDVVDRAAEGYDPVGPLSLGNDGALYGATSGGGSAGLGTLFRIDAAGGFALLHSFSGSDGGPPVTRLVAGADGAMYGTTPTGGSSDLGTVFRVDAAGVFTLLHSFSGSDGADPRAALVLGSDGALYGPTRRGGSSDVGTIFRVNPSGEFESVHSFTGADGARPFTALVRGSDDALYGTAPERGPGGGGVVYRVVATALLPQTVVFDPLPDRTFGDEPFTVSATASSGLPVSFTASGRCTLSGDQVTLTGVGLCTLTASQVGDERFGPADDVSQSFHVLFDFNGFLRPVMNPPVVNQVKAGRSVPIRFSLGGDQGRDVLAEGSPSVRPVPCDAASPVNDVEGVDTRHSSSLHYAPNRGRYTYLWQTDKSWAGTCQELSLELIDDSVHRAIFRFEPVHRPHEGRGERH